MISVSTLRKLQVVALAVASLHVTGCALDEATSQAEQEISVQVTTDRSAYQSVDNVVVSFSGLSGSTTDWIALDLPADADNIYRAWVYTGGGTSGQVTMKASSLSAGTYEARAYNDWAGTFSFSVQARSAPFTIGATSGAVTTDASTYASGAPVVVSYSGLPGTATDWIGISGPGTPSDNFRYWQYTPGTPSGQVTFTGVLPGNYVARSYAMDGKVFSGESVQFTVGTVNVTATTDKTQYAGTEPILVTYSGMTADTHNWITIVPSGAAPDDYGEFKYTQGASSGTFTFTAIPTSGSYEMRAFLNDGFQLVASETFTVAGSPSAVAAQSEYDLGTAVVVNFGNLPGNSTDWVAVSPAGSLATTYSQWAYTQGQVNGSHSFPGLVAGSYEARAYVNDTFTIIAQSPFRVFDPIESMQPSYTTAETVDIRYFGLAGNPTDWISVAPAGSDDMTYTQYVHTAGAKSGHATFVGLPAGSYEARSYLNDTYTVEHRTTFTVN